MYAESRSNTFFQGTLGDSVTWCLANVYTNRLFLVCTCQNYCFLLCFIAVRRILDQLYLLFTHVTSSSRTLRMWH